LNLWLLGQNPTTSTYPNWDMLHEQCPTMGLVVLCGFNRNNTFGTDIFPLRINFDAPDYNDPFSLFPEFEDIFIRKPFWRLTDEEGIVSLVFGNTAFSIMQDVLGEALERQFAFKGIEVYLETNKVRLLLDEQSINMQENGTKTIRNIVLKAPHPSNFQVRRMKERIQEGQIETLLNLAKNMDECCNLAAELVGIQLHLSNYWTARALAVCEDMHCAVEMDEEGFTVSKFI